MPEIKPNPFDYIKPDDTSLATLAAIHHECLSTYDTLVAFVDDSAERMLAIRKLQEFRMWANCAIVMQQIRERTGE